MTRSRVEREPAPRARAAAGFRAGSLALVRQVHGDRTARGRRPVRRPRRGRRRRAAEGGATVVRHERRLRPGAAGRHGRGRRGARGMARSRRRRHRSGARADRHRHGRVDRTEHQRLLLRGRHRCHRRVRGGGSPDAVDGPSIPESQPPRSSTRAGVGDVALATECTSCDDALLLASPRRHRRVGRAVSSRGRDRLGRWPAGCATCGSGSRPRPNGAAGRPDDVTLVAISKTWPVDVHRGRARRRRDRPRGEPCAGTEAEGGRSRRTGRAGTSSAICRRTRSGAWSARWRWSTRSTGSGWRRRSRRRAAALGIDPGRSDRGERVGGGQQARSRAATARSPWPKRSPALDGVRGRAV